MRGQGSGCLADRQVRALLQLAWSLWDAPPDQPEPWNVATQLQDQRAAAEGLPAERLLDLPENQQSLEAGAAHPRAAGSLASDVPARRSPRPFAGTTLKTQVPEKAQLARIKKQSISAYR